MGNKCCHENNTNDMVGGLNYSEMDDLQINDNPNDMVGDLIYSEMNNLQINDNPKIQRDNDEFYKNMERCIGPYIEKCKCHNRFNCDDKTIFDLIKTNGYTIKRFDYICDLYLDGNSFLDICKVIINKYNIIIRINPNLQEKTSLVIFSESYIQYKERMCINNENKNNLIENGLIKKVLLGKCLDTDEEFFINDLYEKIAGDDGEFYKYLLDQEQKVPGIPGFINVTGVTTIKCFINVYDINDVSQKDKK